MSNEQACRLCRYEGAKTFLCDACFEAGQSEDACALQVRRATIAWQERALTAEHRLLDYEGKEMLYSGRTELRAFKQREPLIHNVLNKYLALGWRTDSVQAQLDFMRAVNMLACWQYGTREPVADIADREPLVQEVIRLYGEYALLKHPIDREAMRCTIAEAVRKLAEFSP